MKKEKGNLFCNFPMNAECFIPIAFPPDRSLDWLQCFHISIPWMTFLRSVLKSDSLCRSNRQQAIVPKLFWHQVQDSLDLIDSVLEICRRFFLNLWVDHWLSIGDRHTSGNKKNGILWKFINIESLYTILISWINCRVECRFRVLLIQRSTLPLSVVYFHSLVQHHNINSSSSDVIDSLVARWLTRCCVRRPGFILIRFIWHSTCDIWKSCPIFGQYISEHVKIRVVHGEFFFEETPISGKITSSIGSSISKLGIGRWNTRRSLIMSHYILPEECWHETRHNNQSLLGSYLEII